MPSTRSDDLRWLAERMDMLALTEPQTRSWEDLYKQLRHEIAERMKGRDE